MQSGLPEKYLQVIEKSEGNIDSDYLANMPWPRLLALSEGKGEQMSWEDFQNMIAKRQQKIREQSDG